MLLLLVSDSGHGLHLIYRTIIQKKACEYLYFPVNSFLMPPVTLLGIPTVLFTNELLVPEVFALMWEEAIEVFVLMFFVLLLSHVINAKYLIANTLKGEEGKYACAVFYGIMV